MVFLKSLKNCMLVNLNINDTLITDEGCLTLTTSQPLLKFLNISNCENVTLDSTSYLRKLISIQTVISYNCLAFGSADFIMFNYDNNPCVEHSFNI